MPKRSNTVHHAQDRINSEKENSNKTYDHADPPDEKVRSLIKDCESKQIGLVVGCDANAHRTQWGSTNTNLRAESFLDYILGTDQLLCNKGNDPTFIIKNRKHSGMSSK